MIAYVLKHIDSGEFIARGTGENNRALQLRAHTPMLYVTERTAELAMRQIKIQKLEIKKVEIKEIA